MAVPGLKRIVFWLHLTCGVVVGAVILLMSITGVLLALEPQIVERAEWSANRVTPPGPGARRLGPEALVARARAARPDAAPTALTVRADPAAPARVSLGRDDALFLDPYTGRVLAGPSRAHAVLHAIEHWHRWLGSREVGRPVTGACNLAFLGLAGSGLYLWWPRRWTPHALRLAVRPDLRLRGRARDWNWHTTAGFWCALMIAGITATGAVLSYQWATDLLYTLTGGTPPPSPAGAGAPGGPGGPGGAGRSRPARGQERLLALAPALARAAAEDPRWEAITLRLPARPGAPVTAIVQHPPSWHPAPRSVLTLDPETAEVLRAERPATQATGRTLRTWARVIHKGEAGRLPGQIAAALASAGGAVLVWTGFALGWRRLRTWLLRRRVDGGPRRRDPPDINRDHHVIRPDSRRQPARSTTRASQLRSTPHRTGGS